MEIRKTVNVNISEQELKEIVAEYVGKKVNKNIRPEMVIFDVSKKFDDDDDRFGTLYLKGCSISYLDAKNEEEIGQVGSLIASEVKPNTDIPPIYKTFNSELKSPLITR